MKNRISTWTAFLLAPLLLSLSAWSSPHLSTPLSAACAADPLCVDVFHAIHPEILDDASCAQTTLCKDVRAALQHDEDCFKSEICWATQQALENSATCHRYSSCTHIRNALTLQKSSLTCSTSRLCPSFSEAGFTFENLKNLGWF
jgi:hypothetical protein